MEWRGSGDRYDRANEIRPLGGYGMLNAYAKYALTHEWAVEGRVNNLLDKQYETAYGYNTPGANVFVGVRYAPR